MIIYLTTGRIQVTRPRIPPRTYSEVSRRRKILARLIEFLDDQQRNKGDALRSGYLVTAGSGAYADLAQPASESGTNPRYYGNTGQKLITKEKMRLQDVMLVDLGGRLDRVYKQAVTISDESKIQGRLLDGMEEEVESATSVLQV
jgi:hypothetical protein